MLSVSAMSLGTLLLLVRSELSHLRKEVYQMIQELQEDSDESGITECKSGCQEEGAKHIESTPITLDENVVPSAVPVEHDRSVKELFDNVLSAVVPDREKAEELRKILYQVEGHVISMDTRQLEYLKESIDKTIPGLLANFPMDQLSNTKVSDTTETDEMIKALDGIRSTEVAIPNGIATNASVNVVEDNY